MLACSSQEQIIWRIWSRRSCVLFQYVSRYAQICNRKGYVGLKITEEMVGHKFGEFASTWKFSSSFTRGGALGLCILFVPRAANGCFHEGLMG